MLKNMSVCLRILLFFGCTAAVDVLASENTAQLAAAAKDSLISVQTMGDWIFVPGVPAKGWMDNMKSGKTFRLKNGFIDLRTIAPVTNEKLPEAVLYYQFESPQDGIAELGMACDWWFEAYCNGVLCYSTMKEGNVSETYTPTDHPFFLHVRKGKNLIAVHVKSGLASWSFACGQIPFTIPPRPILLHPPVLMWPDTDGSMSIGFLTCGKIGAGVEYKEKNGSDWTLVWDQCHQRIVRRDFHVVNLNNLKPDTEYVYRTVMIDHMHPGKWNRSNEYTFRMPKKDSPEFSFFFTADLQYSQAEQQSLLRNLLKAADAASCDFIVLGGDIGASFAGNFVVNDLLLILPAQKPVIYMRGNHELRGDEAEHYFDFFAMPNGKTYGLFRYGNTAFMLLDSWEDSSSTTNRWYNQYNLDNDFYSEEIAEIKPLFQTKKWTCAEKRIVLCHGATYTHNVKRIGAFLKQLTDEDIGGKNPKTRVNLWVSGHMHFYMRSIPGTDEIASVGEPLQPYCGGTDYTYPVITVAGPSERSNIKASCFRVDVKKAGIRVRGYTDKGILLEDVFYSNEGKTTVAKELKHYTVSPKK